MLKSLKYRERLKRNLIAYENARHVLAEPIEKLDRQEIVFVEDGRPTAAVEDKSGRGSYLVVPPGVCCCCAGGGGVVVIVVPPLPYM